MTTIRTTSHVGADGILELKLPVEFRHADLEVVVVVQPVRGRPAMSDDDRARWEETVRRLAGSIDDPTFRRHDQGSYEVREQLP